MLTTRAPSSTTRAPGSTRSRALDGVRGVAIIAVLLFHYDVPWSPGGYLGVDVFFVLSGFLITSLLLAEVQRRDRIDLARFWRRRTKRLLPALALLIAVIVLVQPFGGLVESTRQLHGDALATLAQVVNWRLVDAVGTTLVGAVRSPFQHCWSLAIEAQFYLLWPLFVAAVAIGRDTTRARRNVALLAAALTVASAIAMAALVGPDWHTQRSYYGTDTRAQALLVGAVLAAIIGDRFTGQSPHLSAPAKAGVTGAGALALAALAVALLAAPTSGHAMYEGPYLLVAVAAAIVLARLVLVPGGLMPAVLSSRPFVATGRISYSLYLWHWPILLLVNNENTGLSGLVLLVARLAVTVLVASISYIAVESRFR